MQFTVDPLDTDRYCTLAAAKKHLRIEADYTIDDDHITDSIESAAAQVENYCNVLFGTRDFTVETAQLANKIELPVYPVQSITSIIYQDENGDEQTMNDSDYRLFQLDQQRVTSIHFIGNIPSLQANNPSAVTITGVCGLGKVPGDVKKAVKLLIGDSDTYREDRQLAGTDRAVSKLLRPYKY